MATVEVPQPNPGILALKPYVAGRRAVAGRDNPIKLSSNESAFGPSPRAIEAYAATAASLHRYSEPSQALLRAAIGAAHDLDPARIVCGNGSDQLIELLIRAYIRPGDELLLSQNSFEMCRIHGISAGAELVYAPETDYRISVDALLGRVTAKTRLLIIANPNNPTGTYVPAAEIARLHRALPPRVLLVLDGAYMEYVTKEDFDPGFDLARASDNVVVTRTFSKIYGLAALRIGWAYCPAGVVDVLERIRSPFNVSAPAQAAAVAAVQDQEFIRNARRHNATWIERLATALTAIGLQVVPSVANFYLIRFDAASGRSAGAAAAFLEARGIIPRAVGGAEAGNVLRITVGQDHENEAVIAALTAYMKQA